jgi:hypothetical protein
VRKLLSASEIASLKLPGLPTSKVAIISKAQREGWYFEEATGIGGTRRVYELPAKYVAGTSLEPSHAAQVAGTIAAGSSKVDQNKLALAIRALDEWERERGVKVSEERRPAVISVLYGYLERGEAEELEVVLKALG